MVNHRRLVIALVVAACLSGLAEQASAQSQRRLARLSADLAACLTTGCGGVDVWVPGTKDETEVLAARYNVQIKRQLRSGAVMRVTGGQLEALQADGSLDHISSDMPIRPAADFTDVTIGAVQVWEGVAGLAPLTGDRIGVAVLDSGVDRRHPALRDRVVASVDLTGGDDVDRYGHGTHVAAKIAGAAGLTADTAEYQGIATGAHIVSLRVLGDDGSGVASTVIEAVDWAIEHRHRYNIRVINLSLGGEVLQPYRDDPLCEAVGRAIDAGIVVVVAAGNVAPSADGHRVFGTVKSPANHPRVITVGALDTKQTGDRSDDSVPLWSATGPSKFDLVMKPDFVAPGTRVTSAEAAGSYLSTAFPERHVAGLGASSYQQLSGTSMAASVVSGAVALLLESRPRLSPQETKLVLQITSSFMPSEGLAVAGSGSIRISSAVALLSAGPGTGHNQGNRGGSVGDTIFWGQGADDAIFWGQKADDTIIWGQKVDDTIIWGQGAEDTIIWGQAVGDTIIWGQKADDTIIWGQRVDDTIIWGQGAGDTIIWGQSAGDPIIWGQGAGDTIIWGQKADDTIIWGQRADDTIIWGQAGDDTIIWGQGADDTIIWGQSEIGF